MRSDGSTCSRNCRTRSRCSAKSFAAVELIFLQQLLEDRLDERLQLSVAVSDPGHVCVGVERRLNLAATRRRYDHPGLFRDQLGAKIVGMATMTGRDASFFHESLHQWAEVGDK